MPMRREGLGSALMVAVLLMSSCAGKRADSTVESAQKVVTTDAPDDTSAISTTLSTTIAPTATVGTDITVATTGDTVPADPCFAVFEQIENGRGPIDDTPVLPSVHLLDGSLIVDLVQSGKRVGRACTDGLKADPAAVYADVISGPTRTFVTLVSVGRSLPVLESALLISDSTLEGGVHVAVYAVTDRANFSAPGVQRSAVLEATVRAQRPQGSAAIVLNS